MAKSKKILIFSTAYYPFVGGAEVAIKEITDRVSDCSFDLITAKLRSDLLNFERVGNVNVYRLGFGIAVLDKLLLPFWGAIKAKILNNKNQYNFYWAMMVTFASGAGFVANLISNKKVPVVLTLQEGDSEEYLKTKWFGLLDLSWKMALKRSSIVTVISNYLGERAKRLGFQGEPILIPNGVDMEKFELRSMNHELREEIRKELGLENDDVALVTASRLNIKNGVGDVIKALPKLPKNVKFVILGVGELEEELKELTKKLDLTAQAGVSERVIFKGFVSHDEMPKFLKACDIFIRASLSEGFGNSFIEAMAIKIPVIATPVGGIVDFLKENETGYFCQPENPESIAETVQRVMNDSNKNQIVENAFNMVKERYDWVFIAQKMGEVFDGLAKGENTSVSTDVSTDRSTKLKNSKETILITTGIYPPKIGGPAEYAKNLKASFEKMNYEVKIETYGIEERLPTGLRHLFFFFKIIPNVLNADKIFILDTFSVGLPTVLACKIFGKKSIIRTGGDFLWEQYVERTRRKVLLREFYNTEKTSFSLKEKIIFKLTNWTLQNVSHTIFSTDWQRQIFLKAYNFKEKDTSIVENYYGIKEFDYEYDKKEFVGSARKLSWKNLDILSRVFGEIKKEQAEVSLFVENLAYKEFMAKMSRAYAVILISLGDISPNMILDAIRLNRPFICTREVGIYERIKEAGVFVDPLNEEEIKKAVNYLLSADGYWKAKEKVRAFNFTHTWDEIAEEFIEIAGDNSSQTLLLQQEKDF